MVSKNLRYAKVNNHVFNSLSTAEAFCKRNEINLDCIEYRDDPDLLFACQQFAKIQVAALDELKHRLEVLNKQKSDEFARWIAQRDGEASVSSSWDRDFARDQADKICNEIQGIGAAQEVVFKLSEELMTLTGWHSDNVYGLKRGEIYFKTEG